MFQVGPKLPQMDLIAELKRRQVSPLVRETKDGAIEDIITGTVPPIGSIWHNRIYSFVVDSYFFYFFISSKCPVFII